MSQEWDSVAAGPRPVRVECGRCKRLTMNLYVHLDWHELMEAEAKEIEERGHLTPVVPVIDSPEELERKREEREAELRLKELAEKSESKWLEV